MVRRVDTSPKGEGSMRRYFWGDEAKEEAAEEEEAAAAEADNGAQRRRFGEAGLSSGSKSRVRFKVAPQAMAEPGRGAEEEAGGEGGGRGGGGRQQLGRPGLPHRESGRKI